MFAHRTMTLALLLLLSCAVGGPAGAVEILPSVSAPVGAFGLFSVDGSFKTLDFAGSFGFNLNDHPQSGFGCFSFAGCIPGASMFVSARASGSDGSHNIIYAGQPLFPCNTSGFPQLPPGAPADLCSLKELVSLRWQQVGPLPLFTGDTEITVPSEFSALIGVSVRDKTGQVVASGGIGAGFAQPALGNGSINVAWDPEANRWDFRSAEGHIPPGALVPEPATFLLFGTTAAGLGLARWRRRGRKHEHAA
jgi:PEP-CTERM motif-containing protein